MSIFFNIGRNPSPDYVELDSEFITVSNLKNLISRKIGVKVEDIRIKNVLTFVQYTPNQYIKKGSSVSIQITAKNLVDQPLKFHEIISNQHLEALMTDCRFYILKSSNQDNIQKARQCSVWATTFLNQEKFKNAFQCYKHVFFLFGTNRSFELKGLARMESEPDKIPDKSIWNGVSNIRLGGNFKIRWIRKKPLSLTTIEKKLGAEAREQIARATDGYEVDRQIAKKVSLLFDLPSEPYYKLEELLQSKKEKDQGKMSFLNKPNSLMASQLASVMLQNIKESANIDQLGLYDENMPQPVIMIPPSQVKAMKSQSREKSSTPRQSKKKKSKKDKKHKKKKHKKSKSSKKKKRHSRSSSSDSRSRSSSSQRSHRRHKQKHRRIQKHHH